MVREKASRAFAYTALGQDAGTEGNIAGAVQLGIYPALLREEIEQLKDAR